MFSRILFLIVTTICANVTKAQNANPFFKLRYDKVVFYDFESIGVKGAQIFDSKGHVLQKIIKQVDLKSQTVSTLNTRLGDRKSFGAGTAFCFDPHCGFVYFYKGKIVAQILVCLECNRLSSNIDIPAQKQGKQGSGIDAHYLAEGLSKSFRKYLNQLLITHEFSHQIETGSDFDK
ncbi:MAG: hypothetical protein ABW036_04600 [Flavitalea sp.]